MGSIQPVAQKLTFSYADALKKGPRTVIAPKSKPLSDQSEDDKSNLTTPPTPAAPQTPTAPVAQIDLNDNTTTAVNHQEPETPAASEESAPSHDTEILDGEKVKPAEQKSHDEPKLALRQPLVSYAEAVKGLSSTPKVKSAQDKNSSKSIGGPLTHRKNANAMNWLTTQSPVNGESVKAQSPKLQQIPIPNLIVKRAAMRKAVQAAKVASQRAAAQKEVTRKTAQKLHSQVLNGQRAYQQEIAQAELVRRSELHPAAAPFKPMAALQQTCFQSDTYVLTAADNMCSQRLLTSTVATTTHLTHVLMAQKCMHCKEIGLYPAATIIHRPNDDGWASASFSPEKVQTDQSFHDRIAINSQKYVDGSPDQKPAQSRIYDRRSSQWYPRYYGNGTLHLENHAALIEQSATNYAKNGNIDGNIDAGDWATGPERSKIEPKHAIQREKSVLNAPKSRPARHCPIQIQPRLADCGIVSTHSSTFKRARSASVSSFSFSRTSQRPFEHSPRSQIPYRRLSSSTLCNRFCRRLAEHKMATIRVIASPLLSALFLPNPRLRWRMKMNLAIRLFDQGISSLSSSNHGADVVIICGERQWTVHSELLLRESFWLQAVLKLDGVNFCWSRITLHLPEHNPELVGIALDWVYCPGYLRDSPEAGNSMLSKIQFDRFPEGAPIFTAIRYYLAGRCLKIHSLMYSACAALNEAAKKLGEHFSRLPWLVLPCKHDNRHVWLFEADKFYEPLREGLLLMYKEEGADMLPLRAAVANVIDACLMYLALSDQFQLELQTPVWSSILLPKLIQDNQRFAEMGLLPPLLKDPISQAEWEEHQGEATLLLWYEAYGPSGYERIKDLHEFHTARTTQTKKYLESREYTDSLSGWDIYNVNLALSHIDEVADGVVIDATQTYYEANEAEMEREHYHYKVWVGLPPEVEPSESDYVVSRLVVQAGQENPLPEGLSANSESPSKRSDAPGH